MVGCSSRLFGGWLFVGVVGIRLYYNAKTTQHVQMVKLLPTEQPTTQQPTEQPTTQQPTEQPTTQQPTLDWLVQLFLIIVRNYNNNLTT